MVGSFHSETPFTLNRARQLMVRPTPLGELIGAERPRDASKPVVLRRAAWRGITVEALEVESAAHVWLPAWLYLPKSGSGGTRADQGVRPTKLLLVLEPAGRDIRWHEGGLYHTLAQHGYAVCAADVRGVGDLAPEMGRGAAEYARSHADEENYAWASLILGKPLLGQRVTDILALAAALRKHPALRGLTLKVAALSRLTAAALCAAAMDPAIGELYLAGGLISYRSVVETERYGAPFGSFVFGMLQHTDLPDVAASLAPRRVCLAGAVDGAGGTLEVAAVRAAYSGDHVAIRPEAKWDAEALI